MGVPFVDLRAQYHSIKEEIDAALIGTMESCAFTLGPEVAQLEKDFAVYAGAQFAAGVNNGTSALHLALLAAGIGPGDEVITVPFTFIASASAIHYTGAKPVFVDIDPVTFTMDPAALEAAITRRTRAIVPVHLYGQMADMDPIMKIAAKASLAVIEDAAQAISSDYKGKKAGSIGTCGCFSFFPSKNLGGIGDGGMITTNDEAFYKKLVIMRNHGSEPKYYHSFVGGNFRLDPIQAAALLVKLPHLDSWSQARRRNAAYYTGKLKGSIVGTPVISRDCVSIFNQYVIRVPKRDELLKHLQANGVGCEIYYPVPMHLQECFSYLGHKKGDFPQSEKAADEVLALPIYPELTDEMKDYVVKTILDFYS